MKRIFQHPPESPTGRKYWRSLDELSNTPEFREWLEREFPDGASELEENDWSRRDFLKLMGASMALAGIGLTSCRRPTDASGSVYQERGMDDSREIPLLRNGDAASHRRDSADRDDGRWAADQTRRQSAPSRVRGGRPMFLRRRPFSIFTIRRVRGDSSNQRQGCNARRVRCLHRQVARRSLARGDGLAFLVEETHSPTRERLRAELEKTFPKMTWCVYEPALSDAQSYATRASFGENVRLLPRFDRADVILALDSDFLDCGEGDLASSRAFTSRRRVNSANDSMNRLYVVENRFTLTGAMADHRLRLPASQIPVFAYLSGRKDWRS